MQNSFSKLYQRDFEKLISEIELYKAEENLWDVLPNTNNSAGNLALHIIGNLNTFIGKNLGGTSYERDRPAEFALKNVPKAWILDELNKTKVLIVSILSNLTDQDLKAQHPENVLGYEMSNEYFITHLLAHLSYHLGQVNYHRRVVEA